MDKIISILQEPVVLGYAALITIIILKYWSDKKPQAKPYMGLVYHVFNLAEKHIPNESNGFLGKLDFFLQKFCEEYQKYFGADVTPEIKSDVVGTVAKLAYDSNLVKGVKK